MKNPRFYTPVELHTDSDIELDDNTAKHIGKVLRMQPGDKVRLFNGNGREYAAEISALTKKTLTVRCLQELATTPESGLYTHLAISMSRGDRMDYAIQKSVELGVNEITPITSERCELKLSGDRADKKLSHWQQVAISACEQCGRAVIPTINTIKTFDAFTQEELNDALGLVLHHRDTQSLDSIQPAPSKVVLLIGPEGGLSENEIESAIERGFKACTLGPRVFRTETAPVASLAVMQWLWGDFNSQ